MNPKLAALDAAESLDDLRSPPGNRLHALQRERAGQHAIRINDQFRLCFIWTEAGPERVEFTDYHRGVPAMTDAPHPTLAALRSLDLTQVRRSRSPSIPARCSARTS